MILVLSTVGISCTIMVIWEALELGLGDVLGSEGCAALIFGPVIIYMIICFKGKQKSQLFWAQILTVVYAIVMVLLTVSIFAAAGECPMNLTAFFLIFLAGIHILAAVLHWDFGTLICGLIYWVAIPSNFMFLQIYMLTNINDVSWGTRSGVAEVKKEKITIRQRIESYYKGKPYPGIGTILRYIWNGPPKDADAEQELKTQQLERKESSLETYESVLDKKGSTDESDSEDEEFDRQFTFVADYDKFGISTDDEDRLKDLHTDDLKHSPFAVFGGVTIDQLRKETTIKNNRRSRARMSTMKEQVGSSFQQRMFHKDCMKFEMMSDPGGEFAFSIDKFREDMAMDDDPSAELLKRSNISKFNDPQYSQLAKYTSVYSWVTPELEKLAVDEALREGQSGNLKSALKTGRDIRTREQKNYRDLVIIFESKTAYSCDKG